MSRVGTALLTVGPHYYFDTALNTLCLTSVELVATQEAMLALSGVDSPPTCATCLGVVAVYRKQQLLPEGDRCQGTTRGGYRCQRDGVYNGYCPSHIDQDPERTHLHPQAVAV